MTFRYKQQLKYLRYAGRAFAHDVRNTVKYGSQAPKFGERIYVTLSDELEVVSAQKEQLYGQVLDSWPPPGFRKFSKFTETEPFGSCVQHWEGGVPWEATRQFRILERKIHERGCSAGCRNVGDLLARYAALDNIFELMRRQRRLAPCAEYNQWCFRETEGVVFDVGPGGKCFFAKKGQHRLSMAIILGIRSVPAALGGIYIGSLPLLGRLRSNRAG